MTDTVLEQEFAAAVEEAQAEVERPVRVHLAYNYGGDVNLPLDKRIVKAIRKDFDPLFVPVVKIEVYQWKAGSEKRFVHFGFGVGHTPGMPIFDMDVYRAPKPHSGYFATLERAMIVSDWVQTEQPDGTPGPTIPFDERAYAHAKICDENMRRLAAKAPSGDANEIPGVMDEFRQLAYKALTTMKAERKADEQKQIDDASAHLRDVLKDEKKHNQSFLELTEDDRMAMAALHADPNHGKNPVHFFTPARPAQPGGIIVVPR